MRDNERNPPAVSHLMPSGISNRSPTQEKTIARTTVYDMSSAEKI